MPYALHTLSAPGSLAAGYRRGDEVHPSVIENWSLIEGEDWQADRPDAAPSTVPPRPADDTDRGAWVSYVVARGTDPAEADDMPLADLMDLYPEDEQAPADSAHPRPADSARKSEWVSYVNDHPQATAEDQAWAGDDSTTKADLMAWEPSTQQPSRPADPVAESATEQANG